MFEKEVVLFNFREVVTSSLGRLCTLRSEPYSQFRNVSCVLKLRFAKALLFVSYCVHYKAMTSITHVVLFVILSLLVELCVTYQLTNHGTPLYKSYNSESSH